MYAAILVVGVAVAAGFISGGGGPGKRAPSAQVPGQARYLASMAASAVSAVGTRVAAHQPPAPQPLTAAEQARSVDRVLRYASYARILTARRREVALTFDDGPSPYTPQILHSLTRMGARATFFAIGRSVAAYPHLVADEVRDGCEVGDHTETHPPLAALSPEAQTLQLVDAATAIERAGAPHPRLLRPPYGSFDQATLDVLHEQRMLMVLWSVDTSDYIRPGIAKIAHTAISGATPGAIILMHDGGGNRAETVAALPKIITALRRRGYRLVTLSQLITDDPPPAHQRPPQPLSGL